MSLEGCDESCGWAFAVISALAWGSFGVPIKGSECSKVDVDPLVMQTYKTVMNSITSIVLLWYLGDGSYTENYWVFTPWGIISGLFWVPGATCGIYAIRSIGLAVSQGLWSSIIVMTSFVVGIFFFKEKVKSVTGAVFATTILITGIGGMARYSNPDRQPPLMNERTTGISFQERAKLLKSDRSFLETNTNPDEITEDIPTAAFPGQEASRRIIRTNSFTGDSQVNNDRKRIVLPFELESAPSTSDESSTANGILNHFKPSTLSDASKIHSFLGLNLTKRQLGLGGAIINGVWGGSNLIPMHFARRSGNPGGLAYLLSFAIGSLLVCIFCWLFRYLYHVHQTKSLSEAFFILPSFHLRKLWLPGGISGLCYGVGNIGSILSVLYLGQGVGYSLSQSSMLISGLWGIFYYKEIRGEDMVLKWLIAAIVTMIGILWLSYQHESDASAH